MSVSRRSAAPPSLLLGLIVLQLPCPYESKGGCFALDTPVTLSDGSWRAIRDIHPGDIVQSWDTESNSLSQAKVLEVPRFQRSNMITLEVLGGGSRGKIHATDDHPFWSSRLQKIVSRDPTFTSQKYGLPSFLLEDSDDFQDNRGLPVPVRVLSNSSVVSKLRNSRALAAVEVATLVLDRHHWFFAHGLRTHNKGGGGGGGSSSSSGGRSCDPEEDEDCGKINWPVAIGSIVVCCGCLIGSEGMRRFGSKEAEQELTSRVEARTEMQRGAEVGIETADGKSPPSGKWSGTYKENRFVSQMKGENIASYSLDFACGQLTGTGHDADGSCSVNGAYNMQTGDIRWQEVYSWGSIEAEGTISVTGKEASISASFVSSLNITGTLLIKAQGYQVDLREAAREELYGNPIEREARAKGALPPDLERCPSFKTHKKGNVAKRAPIQAGYALKRALSRETLGARLKKDRAQADGRLGASKLNLDDGNTKKKKTAKVAPDPGAGLPSGWQVVYDKTYHTGQPYYWNKGTGQTSWVKPR